MVGRRTGIRSSGRQGDARRTGQVGVQAAVRSRWWASSEVSAASGARATAKVAADQNPDNTVSDGRVSASAVGVWVGACGDDDIGVLSPYLKTIFVLTTWMLPE
jgi:hypothetical protein